MNRNSNHLDQQKTLSLFFLFFFYYIFGWRVSDPVMFRVFSLALLRGIIPGGARVTKCRGSNPGRPREREMASPLCYRSGPENADLIKLGGLAKLAIASLQNEGNSYASLSMRINKAQRQEIFATRKNSTSFFPSCATYILYCHILYCFSYIVLLFKFHKSPPAGGTEKRSRKRKRTSFIRLQFVEFGKGYNIEHYLK